MAMYQTDAELSRSELIVSREYGKDGECSPRIEVGAVSVGEDVPNTTTRRKCFAPEMLTARLVTSFGDSEICHRDPGPQP
jgi:hypothetical protein